MAVKITDFDTADYLDSPEALAAYLDAVFEEGDPAVLTLALGAVARAHGMAGVDRDAGLSRESLYRALGSAGNPVFG
jgi:probable addiction module antidote protein